MGSNFYGGRDGQPFVIKQTFKTLDLMLDSKEIDYQEYALLSYDNHNHPLHGTLYRKNFDINSSRTLNDYEYKDGKWDLLEVLPKAKGFYQVGNLKGSTGTAGLINIVDMESYTDLLNNAKNDSSVSVIEHIKPGESKGSISFVSPDDVDGKMQWCSFSKHSDNHDYCEAVIGLQIPYYEFEVGETFPLEPHEANETKTEVVVDDNNPFKYTMNFYIPKGSNGSSYRDLEIIENDDGHFLACTFVDYSTEPPTETRHILGKYNVVESLSMEDGQFSISLTDGQTQTVSLKTIEEIKLEDGAFKVKYNYADDFVEFGELQNLVLDTVTIDSNDTNLINPNLKVGGIAIVVEEV